MSTTIVAKLTDRIRLYLPNLGLRADREYCDRLQNSLVRGSHELLYWGIGPSLRLATLMSSIRLRRDSSPTPSTATFGAFILLLPIASWLGRNQHVFLNRASILIRLSPTMSRPKQSDCPFSHCDRWTNVRAASRGRFRATPLRREQAVQWWPGGVPFACAPSERHYRSMHFI